MEDVTEEVVRGHKGLGEALIRDGGGGDAQVDGEGAWVGTTRLRRGWTDDRRRGDMFARDGGIRMSRI